MQINVQEQGSVAVVKPAGKITTGSGDVNLREKIRSLLDGGKRAIVIDLSEVKHIDSGGIGEMVSAYTTAKNRGAVIKLASMPEKVLAIFQMTQLITVFDVFDTPEEAVKSFD